MEVAQAPAIEELKESEALFVTESIENVIVIGGTGSGKSSLIKYLGGKQFITGDSAEVGHDGLSKTDRVDAYIADLKYHGGVEKLLNIKDQEIKKP